VCTKRKAQRSNPHSSFCSFTLSLSLFRPLYLPQSHNCSYFYCFGFSFGDDLKVFMWKKERKKENFLMDGFWRSGGFLEEKWKGKWGNRLRILLKRLKLIFSLPTPCNLFSPFSVFFQFFFVCYLYFLCFLCINWIWWDILGFQRKLFWFLILFLFQVFLFYF